MLTNDNLLKLIQTISEDDKKRFLSAVKADDIDTVKSYFLSNSAYLAVTHNDFTDYGYWLTAFDLAAASGSLKIVDLILSQQRPFLAANPYIGKKALFLAAANGHSQVVEKLLAYETIKRSWQGIPDYSTEPTPLQIAANNGHVECVKALLNSKIFNTNAEVNIGRASHTALDEAAKNNHIAVVKLLLDNGANINGAFNSEISHFQNNWSPLHFAANRNYNELADFLLNYPNINVNLDVNSGGSGPSGTPLGFALDRGNFKITYKILMHKLGFNPLLWLTGLAGIGLIVTGAGALLGWSVMAGLLPFISVAIAVSAIGGLLLAGSLIYRFGAQLKQVCLSCFKGKDESVDSLSLKQTARNLQLASSNIIEPDATAYSRLYALNLYSTAKKSVEKQRRNSI